MVRRPLVLLLNAVFALALFAGPAAAVTFVSITPSNTNNAGAPYLLVADAIYTYNSPTMEIGTVNDTFTFQYTPPPNLAAASSVAINDLSPVFPMTLNWLFNTTNSLIGAVSAQPSAVSASPGADINTTLSLADGAGFYFLQLSGTVSPTGGQYNLSVQTSETPLPSTIVLLGSVFVGSAGFGAFRRRKANAA